MGLRVWKLRANGVGGCLILECQLKDDINRDDILALTRHLRVLDEFLDVLDRKYREWI